MSRIGKMPVVLPTGITAEINGQQVVIRGPKGELSQKLAPEIRVELVDNSLKLSIAQQTKRAAGLWGLYRTLLANMVRGVSEGFQKQLEMAGVGHRASMQGSNLQLAVGFSHPVIITPSEGISFAVAENTKITVSGIDKVKVGQAAAEIRGVKPPEPYKGKGIHYAGERIRRKAGKAAKAGSK